MHTRALSIALTIACLVQFASLPQRSTTRTLQLPTAGIDIVLSASSTWVVTATNVPESDYSSEPEDRLGQSAGPNTDVIVGVQRVSLHCEQWLSTLATGDETTDELPWLSDLWAPLVVLDQITGARIACLDLENDAIRIAVTGFPPGEWSPDNEAARADLQDLINSLTAAAVVSDALGASADQDNETLVAAPQAAVAAAPLSEVDSLTAQCRGGAWPGAASYPDDSRYLIGFGGTYLCLSPIQVGSWKQSAENGLQAADGSASLAWIFEPDSTGQRVFSDQLGCRDLASLAPAKYEKWFPEAEGMSSGVYRRAARDREKGVIILCNDTRVAHAFAVMFVGPLARETITLLNQLALEAQNL